MRHPSENRCAYMQRMPGGSTNIGRIIGLVCIGIGALLIFLCLPGWAWLTLLGAALIAVGFLILRIKK